MKCDRLLPLSYFMDGKGDRAFYEIPSLSVGFSRSWHYAVWWTIVFAVIWLTITFVFQVIYFLSLFFNCFILCFFFLKQTAVRFHQSAVRLRQSAVRLRQSRESDPSPPKVGKQLSVLWVTVVEHIFQSSWVYLCWFDLLTSDQLSYLAKARALSEFVLQAGLFRFYWLGILINNYIALLILVASMTWHFFNGALSY